jgi:hypothetical protein
MSACEAINDVGQAERGVGARHRTSLRPIRGGGYQDICTVSQIRPRSTDARLQELEAIGISDPWLSIARTVGVDQFLAIWEILDAENAGVARGGRQKVRVWIPLYATYLRHQRNRYIKQLAAESLRPQQIQKRVRSELCEHISLRHIARIIAAA